MNDLQIFSEVAKMASLLKDSGDFIPAHFKGNAGAIAAAILTGRELGLSPMASLRGLYVVRGKVGVSYDVIVGLLRKNGYDIFWVASNKDKAEVKLTHKNGTSMCLSYTKEDAQVAGLWNSGIGWKNHPATMLRARCISNAARAFAGEILSGVYCEDEIEEMKNISEKNRENVYENAEDALLVAIGDANELSIESKVNEAERFLNIKSMILSSENIENLLGVAEKIKDNAELCDEEVDELRTIYQEKKASLTGENLCGL